MTKNVAKKPAKTVNLRTPGRREVLGGLGAALTATALPRAAGAQSAAFMQAVAEASATDRDLARFYKANGYGGIWTASGGRDAQRRRALAQAISEAGSHGLPVERFSPELLTTRIRSVRSEADLGRLEVELSRIFVDYARSVQTGMTTPRSIDRDLVRKVPLRDRAGLVDAFARSSPRAFMQALPPDTDDYAALMKLKLQLEGDLGRAPWGAPVPTGRTLRPGDSGARVVALRNRLIAKGYMRRTTSPAYDEDLVAAVRRFQFDYGMATDGVAGPATLGELNASVAQRLSQVHVAMERERWMNRPEGRGRTHIWVNLPDFRTKLIDDGRVTFETVSVVGEQHRDKRTPEFSDMMTYMEVNPTWTVPRSILGRDYLPKFQEDPQAARYLQLIDEAGRVVPRDGIDFSQYTEETFPFTVRQPPSERNALGLVKFMFPNPHAIYLHDTPQKHLFRRDLRAYSSGCIRLNDPFDFAYELLGRQMSNPKSFFDAQLRTGEQRRINLETPIPVHLVYRTAFVTAEGRPQFRRDFYGRDARIWAALENAGVALG